MTIAQFAYYLILIHASMGGISLLLGVFSLASKKGSPLHRKSGKFYTVTMLITAISALVICILPGHYSIFLFLIGIFSTYFLLSGRRALRFSKLPVGIVDYLISLVLILTGVCMIVLPLFLNGRINIVLLVFGCAAIVFGIRDLALFNNSVKLRKSYLILHLGNMTASFISATTAFVVVNSLIPGIYGWIAPGVIGGVFIAVSSRKIARK